MWSYDTARMTFCQAEPESAFREITPKRYSEFGAPTLNRGQILVQPP